MTEEKKNTVNSEYTAKDLEHLSDLEHVRERPAMYIGDTTVRGLHHLVYEVVDNSIDEAMANYASQVQVTINGDDSVTVEDDGRGIPIEPHEQLTEQMGREVSTLEGVMTVLKFGGKFTKGAYQTSGGLHGVGVTVVNFLSEWCEVEICRDGHVYHQEYERGIPKTEVRRVGTTDRRGTKATFKPDPQIFQVLKFKFSTLQKRLQELAFLNQGVRITINDDRTGESETFQYENGIREYVEHLNRASEAVHNEVLHVSGESEGVVVEMAMQYSGEFTENVHTYVNNISTTEGGTHLSGYRSALTRSLNAYGKKAGMFKDIVPHRRRHPRGAHRRAQRARTAPAVRRPDENQAGQRRGRGHRQLDRRRVPGQIPGGKSLECKGHRPQGPAGGRGSRECPKGPAIDPRTQGGPLRRRAAGETPRLLESRRRQVRAVPRRGRFGRRECRGRTDARVPGHPAASG